MKSAVFYGKHDLRIEDYPMPKAGAHDIVIQVKACGVCGTDVHIYDCWLCFCFKSNSNSAAHTTIR